MGAILIQIVVAIISSLCVMFCFCTLLLTFAKAMILRWIKMVMPEGQTQMPLLGKDDLDDDNEDNDNEEMEVEGSLLEVYPF